MSIAIHTDHVALAETVADFRVKHGSLTAARALLDHTEMTPAQIVKRSLEIAGDLCIYTNQQHTVETLE